MNKILYSSSWWPQNKFYIHDNIISLILTSFVFLCIFDPTDMTRTKVSLFCMAWISSISFIIMQKRPLLFPKELLIYTLIFIAIPAFSVALYFPSNNLPYEGFNQLKGFLFITLASLLVISRVDILPSL